MTDQELLSCIGYQEPSTFQEFCNAIPPSRKPSGPKEWGMMMARIYNMEKFGLISITKHPTTAKITTLQLTPDGAEEVREYKKKRLAQLGIRD